LKKLLTLLIIASVLPLSSCAASVSYSLSDENAVTSVLSVTLPSGEDTKKYTDSIKKYWESMGFETELSGDGATLSGIRKDGFDSRLAAAEGLSKILADEKSLFHNVRFVYTPSYFKDEYSLDADVSLADVIRRTESQRIPQGEVESLLEKAQGGKYCVSIGLPGKILSENADSVENGVCTWNIQFAQTRSIRVRTEKEFADRIAEYSALAEAAERDDALITLCAVAGGAVFLALVVVLILRRR